MTELHTIGYEGASPEDFIASLKRKGIQQIIDIRELPQSRRKGFSKNQLASILGEHGISYVHIRQLGDPKHGRDAARAGRYEEFKQIYSAHLELSSSVEALKAVSEFAQEKTSALMCYERDYKQCHRFLVAQKMNVLYKFSIDHMGVAHGEAGRQYDRQYSIPEFDRASI